MSCKVAVLCEDPIHDRYIVEPLLKRLFVEAGRPAAQIQVINARRVTGYEHVKKALLSGTILQDYRAADLVLFLPDADGKDRGAEFSSLEAKARELGTALLCCAAVEEVEAWLLAGHLDKLSQHKNIRSRMRLLRLIAIHP